MIDIAMEERPCFLAQSVFGDRRIKRWAGIPKNRKLKRGSENFRCRGLKTFGCARMTKGVVAMTPGYPRGQALEAGARP